MQYTIAEIEQIIETAQQYKESMLSYDSDLRAFMIEILCTSLAKVVYNPDDEQALETIIETARYMQEYNKKRRRTDVPF